MTRVLLAKMLGSLRPIDEAGEEFLRGMGQGEIIAVEAKRPRNLKHHRMFWALMTIVQKQRSDDYPTVEDAVAAVKIAAGHRSRIALPGGHTVFVPKSISFAKMDQTEFDAFYDRVCDVIAWHFLLGVTQIELKAEVESMIGIRPIEDARRRRAA